MTCRYILHFLHHFVFLHKLGFIYGSHLCFSLLACPLRHLKLGFTSIAFDSFSILDIASSADLVTIKKRYKQLSLEWHPDRILHL